MRQAPARNTTVKLALAVNCLNGLPSIVSAPVPCTLTLPVPAPRSSLMIYCLPVTPVGRVTVTRLVLLTPIYSSVAVAV